MERDTFDGQSIILSVAVAVATVLTALLLFCDHAPSWFNSQKSFELAVQFLIVAVLGGAVGLAYQAIDAQRAARQKTLEKATEVRQLRRKALEEFHRNFVVFYHESKKIRRLLRASSFVDAGRQRVCQRREFENLMRQLEDAQLTAERLFKEVGLQKDLFGSEGAALEAKLDSVEKYLRCVLRHYEDRFEDRYQTAPDELIPVSPALANFLERGRSETSPTETQFFQPADGVQKTLLGLIEAATR